MLDPDLIISSFVSAVRSIPSVVTQMGGLTDDRGLPTISSHDYLYGEENSLTRVIWEMRVPSILITYTGSLWGNFSGDQLWMHQIDVYYRPRNAASIGGSPTCSAPHLWYLILHDPVEPNVNIAQANGVLNIRQIRLLPSLLLIKNPMWKYVADQPGGDLFQGSVTIPELGDD